MNELAELSENINIFNNLIQQGFYSLQNLQPPDNKRTSLVYLKFASGHLERIIKELENFESPESAETNITNETKEEVKNGKA